MATQDFTSLMEMFNQLMCTDIYKETSCCKDLDILNHTAVGQPVGASQINVNAWNKCIKGQKLVRFIVIIFQDNLNDANV